MEEQLRDTYQAHFYIFFFPFFYTRNEYDFSYIACFNHRNVGQLERSDKTRLPTTSINRVNFWSRNSIHIIIISEIRIQYVTYSGTSMSVVESRPIWSPRVSPCLQYPIASTLRLLARGESALVDIFFALWDWLKVNSLPTTARL